MKASLLNAALAYAAKGMPVFPLAPGTKVPMKGSHGHLDATTREAVVRANWELHPRSLLAHRAAGVTITSRIRAPATTCPATRWASGSARASTSRATAAMRSCRRRVSMESSMGGSIRACRQRLSRRICGRAWW